MAKTVTVILVDDVDGTCADETVAFGLDGSSYEIDLGSDNATKLRLAFTLWADAGRPAQGPARDGGADGRRPHPERIQANAVRVWARRYGFEVGERGRVPLRLIEAYESANQPVPTAKTRVSNGQSNGNAPATTGAALAGMTVATSAGTPPSGQRARPNVWPGGTL